MEERWGNPFAQQEAAGALNSSQGSSAMIGACGIAMSGSGSFIIRNQASEKTITFQEMDSFIEQRQQIEDDSFYSGQPKRRGKYSRGPYKKKSKHNKDSARGSESVCSSQHDVVLSQMVPEQSCEAEADSGWRTLVKTFLQRDICSSTITSQHRVLNLIIKILPKDMKQDPFYVS